MPTKRAAAPKKTKVSPWHISQTLAWLFIATSFALALMLVCTFKRTQVVASDLRHTVESLRLQKMHTRAKWLQAEEAKADKPLSAKAKVPVLFAVTAFRDGEKDVLQQNLVEPLLGYYAKQTALPRSLQALLIERKNAGSKDVAVSLFFDDGVRESYLWPSTHAVESVWAADCAMTPDKIDLEFPVLCPAGYVRPIPARK